MGGGNEAKDCYAAKMTKQKQKRKGITILEDNETKWMISRIMAKE
jgi:hypothetical protein